MRDKRLSLRAKIFLSLFSIAVVLLISSIISVMEFRRMSSYISDMVADNIESINAAQKLYDDANSYNLAILSVIGDETSSMLPGFDETSFSSRLDSLRSSAPNSIVAHLADSVQYAYAAYMLTSLELEDVLVSDFIDTRSWYQQAPPRHRQPLKRHLRRTRKQFCDLPGRILQEHHSWNGCSCGRAAFGGDADVLPGIELHQTGLPHTRFAGQLPQFRKRL